MRRYWFVFVSVLVLGAVNTGRLSAEVFYNTGAPEPVMAWTISGLDSGLAPQAVADQVVITGPFNWQLERITVTAWHASGTVNKVKMVLMDDNGQGSPGTMLCPTCAWDIELPPAPEPSDPPVPPAPSSVETPDGPTLRTGVTYWFAMFPGKGEEKGQDDQVAMWNMSIPVRGPVALTDDSGETWQTFPELRPGTVVLEGTH